MEHHPRSEAPCATVLWNGPLNSYPSCRLKYLPGSREGFIVCVCACVCVKERVRVRECMSNAIGCMCWHDFVNSAAQEVVYASLHSFPFHPIPLQYPSFSPFFPFNFSSQTSPFPFASQTSPKLAIRLLNSPPPKKQKAPVLFAQDIPNAKHGNLIYHLENSYEARIRMENTNGCRTVHLHSGFTTSRGWRCQHLNSQSRSGHWGLPTPPRHLIWKIRRLRSLNFHKVKALPNP